MKKNEIKIDLGKHAAMTAAFRNWSEGAIEIDQNDRKKGSPWEVSAHGGTMETYDALVFGSKVQAAATIANELNEAGLKVEWNQEPCDVATRNAMALNIEARLTRYDSDFWTSIAGDIIDILTA